MTRLLALLLVVVTVSVVLSSLSFNLITSNKFSNTCTDSKTKISENLPIDFEFVFPNKFLSIPRVVDTISTNNLTNSKCTSTVLDVSPQSMTIQLSSCPVLGNLVSSSNGEYVIQNFTNSISYFTVNGITVPAVLYLQSGSNLVYQIAKDANGLFWNDPVVLSRNFSFEFSTSRLQNFNNTPSLAYYESEFTLRYIHGSDPSFLDIDYSSSISFSSIAFEKLVGLTYNIIGQPLIVFVSRNADISPETNFKVTVLISQTNGVSWNTPIIIASYVKPAGTVNLRRIECVSTSSCIAVSYSFRESGLSVYFISSLNSEGTLWPQTSFLISSAPTGDLNFFQSQLFLFNNRMSILYSLGKFDCYLKQADDETGSSWQEGRGYRICGENGVCYYPSVCVRNSYLALSYIDDSYSIRYGVYKPEFLEFVTNRDTTIKMKQNFPVRALLSFLKDGTVSFLISLDYLQSYSPLYYFLPITEDMNENLEIVERYTMKYAAVS